MAKCSPIEYRLHPLREALYNELHIRPFHNLETPQQITHLVACCEDHVELDQSYDVLCELCRRYEINLPQADTVAFHQSFGDFVVHWERHAEFYSLTIIQPGESTGEPFEYTPIDLLPADWTRTLPGQMIAAFHLLIDEQHLDYSPTSLSRYFEGHPVMVSNAYDSKAQIFSAFKLHGDGHGRFIIRNVGLNSSQMGRLSRRVMDLETYRLLALLSLPTAKKISPQLLDMDKQLAEILSGVTDLEDTTGSERELLEQITQVEAQLETYRAETNHRFSATRAYHQLVADRLKGIKESPIEGHLPAGEFINRRLDPALRTCASVQAWMDDLSTRVERASDLMRTRVNLNLQEQNRSQLTAMNRRSKLQFRLQETVEGLSIAAISYYAVGLLGYLFGGLPLKQWGVDKSVLIACSIPVVLVTIWAVTRRIKHKLIKSQEEVDEE